MCWRQDKISAQATSLHAQVLRRRPQAQITPELVLQVQAKVAGGGTGKEGTAARHPTIRAPSRSLSGCLCPTRNAGTQRQPGASQVPDARKKERPELSAVRNRGKEAPYPTHVWIVCLVPASSVCSRINSRYRLPHTARNHATADIVKARQPEAVGHPRASPKMATSDNQTA